jgi:hypothetical protein
MAISAPTAAQISAIVNLFPVGGVCTAGWHKVAISFATVTDGVITDESSAVELPARIKTGLYPPYDTNLFTIRLNNLPVSTDPVVNARVIYISEAATLDGLTGEYTGGDTLYRISAEATISDNSTTTYDISIADGSLTAITPPGSTTSSAQGDDGPTHVEPVLAANGVSRVNADRLLSEVKLGYRRFLSDGVNAHSVDYGDLAATRLMGVRPPTSNFTAANGAAGVCTAGTHLIGVTFAVVQGSNILAESNIKELVSVSAAGSKKIALAALPVSDNLAVNARIVYMTTAGGTILYRLGTGPTITNNTDATYDINVADTGLSAIQLSYANAFIEAKPYSAIHGDRILFWGGVTWNRGTVAVVYGSKTITFTGAQLTRAMEGRIFQLVNETTAYTVESVNVSAQTALLTVAYASASATGQYYTLTNEASDLIVSNQLPDNIEGYDVADANTVISIAGDDGDEPRGIGRVRDMLVLGKRQHMYLLINKSPSTYEITEISNNHGLASHWAWSQIHDGSMVYYAGAAGIFLLQGNQPVAIAQRLAPLLGEGVNHDLDEQSHSVYDRANRLWYLWVASAPSSRRLDRCIVGDFSRYPEQIAWWEYSLTASLSRSILSIDGTERIIIGDYQGQVHVLSAGLTDGCDTATNAGTVTSVDEVNGTITDSAASFEAESTGTLAGSTITMLSGACKGQRRWIKDCTGTVLTLDVRDAFDGWFAGTIAAGDRYAIGKIDGYWRSPEFGRTPENTRWLQCQIERMDVDDQGTVRVGIYGGETRGMTLLAVERVPLTVAPVSLVKMENRHQKAQVELRTDKVAQPWGVGGMTLLAGDKRGVRS